MMMSAVRVPFDEVGLFFNKLIVNIIKSLDNDIKISKSL